MNKHLYRIVFNKARGLLMVVAENVSSQGKSPGVTACGKTSGFSCLATLQPLRFSLLLALGMVWLPAQAEIIADRNAPGNQRPGVFEASNGTPLVNIQTPSAAGVSRNVYSQFDVDGQGVILNNSRTNTQTQLGGWVEGNPWLAGGGARVILNEVNSSDPSRLHGYIEVAGQRAQVVIANPAGISCDGCGFINASRATLTTGQPQLSGGRLDGYLVQDGKVLIEGAGLDASRSDFTEIIARSVEVNAGIWAGDLTVVAGANRVSADQQQISAITGQGAAPAVAIDVAQLGGMYAGKITLVGNEAGVGVRNAGQLGASAGDVVISADGRLENFGSIASSGSVRLQAGGDLDNAGAQIQALGDMQVAVAGQVDNRGGLLRAGQALSLSAQQLDNSQTQGAEQGLEGGSVNLQVGTVDNVSGVLRADTDLSLSSDGRLNNSQGAIAAGRDLQLTDSGSAPASLVIDNADGTLIAGRALTIDAAQYSGDGQALSLGDLSLQLAGDYNHSGLLQAAGDLDMKLAGQLSNQGDLLAGARLDLQAAALDNQQAGEISAGQVQMQVQGELSNRGLIDAEQAELRAGQLSNIGSGRIYADHLSIATDSLLNTDEQGEAGVIAARERLDIGARSLVNREQALIFSAGDLAIGGELDAQGHASGQADSLHNASATVEALGDLALNVRAIHNSNEHFSTHIVEISRTPMQEFQLSGSPNRYLPGQISTYRDEVNYLVTPEGRRDNWNRYDYTRVVRETQILTSEPGQILAGGNLSIEADELLNDKSQIIAGGLLQANIDSLTNTEVTGQHITSDSGTVTNFYRIQRKGRDRQGSRSSTYRPAPLIQEISLQPSVYMQHATPDGSGLSLASVSVAPALDDQNGSGIVEQVRSGTLALKVPTSALFRPASNASYLIETDPRFTNYRTWLSSDYMLQRLAVDPATAQKRLGDGFYEQKLIREQVAQLTGRRFLDGHADDEAQYLALIDSAVTLAQAWQLVPGVALSAEQMAQLTSDIVWLVEREVTLADGSTSLALVPQVYVRVREGDLDGHGALLAGQTLNLDVSGDLLNSGSLGARGVAAITAENLSNLGGRIQGNSVDLHARNDLNNLGGQISANENLTISAGRDLNLISNTLNSTSEQGSRQMVSRIAGLFVSQPAGKLLAAAGRDLRMQAAQVVNSGAEGQTLLAAGRDLSVGTQTESHTQNIRWDSANWRKEASSQEVGSSIQTQGDLHLQAGNDLLLRASSASSSDGALLASAGRDIQLSAGSQTRDVDEAHKSVGRSGISAKTTTTRDSFSDDQALTSSLAGTQTVLQAGRDIGSEGAQLLGTDELLLVAGRDINLLTATSSGQQSSSKSRKSLTSADSRSSSHETAVQQGSVLQSEGDVTLSAGEDLTLFASRIKAGNNVALDAGRDIAILSAQDESASSYTEKGKGLFGRGKGAQGESYASSNVASVIEAGHDLTINTSKTSGGGLSIDGGRDVIVVGSQLKAGDDLLIGATGDIAVLSGIEEHGSYSKQSKSGYFSLSKSGNNQLQTKASQVASELDAGNDVVIAAGNDIRLRASEVMAGNDAELRAGLLSETGDITLVSAIDTAYSLAESYKKKVGLSFSVGMLSFSSAKKAGQEALGGTNVASRVTAERDATLQAERDINVTGSSVSAGRNLLLDAGRDINVAAAQNRSANATWERERHTGVGISSDRNGFTAFAGNDVQVEKARTTEQTAAASLLGAGNDLDLRAGRDINQTGSDLLAGRDINLGAERNINLDAASERAIREKEEVHQRNGLTVNISHNFGNTVDAIKGVGQGDNAISQVSSVLKAADAVTQFVSGPTTAEHLGTTRQQTETLSGVVSSRPSTLVAGRDVNVQAGNDIVVRGSEIQSGRDINMAARDITLDVARGQQTNLSEQTLSQGGINGGTTFNSARTGIGGSHGTHTEDGRGDTSLPSQLYAGRDVNLLADRDIDLIGTQVLAERDIDLKAGNDLSIRAAQNDADHEMRRKSGGGEVGIALGGQDFIAVYASVDIGKGRLGREGGQQQDAYLHAGNRLNFESGRDTTVAGARMEGGEVTGQVGRDLLVSSVADTGKVSGKEFDASLTVSVGMYGSVSASGSVGMGKTSGSTDWVQNQTSIVARDKMDIRTENHTQLDGASLVSDTGNLKLDTGTLGFRDIKGHDREHAWYVNAGGSYTWGGDSTPNSGQPQDGNASATAAVVDPSQENKGGNNNWTVSGYEYEKNREQLVRATVGTGEIVVRSDAETGNDSTAGLNRDISKAYEVTKDEKENTSLYVSGSSLDALSNPEETLNQWKAGVKDYGRNAVQAFTNLAALKQHALSAAEHNKLVAALAWAPELLIDAMDAMNMPTLGVFPGVENHGGLITQLPVLATGDLQPLRVTGVFKTDSNDKLELDKTGKPILESHTVERFDGFNDDDKIFTNGIMNSMIEALANGLMQTGNGSGETNFVLAYNPTHGLIGDLIESAFDKNSQGAVLSGTARNLNSLFQQGIDAGPDSLHIYGHSQGGLLTWVAIKGLDFSTVTMTTIQLSGAPVDAVKFHKDAYEAGFREEEQRFFQVNRPDETVFFGLLPKTDTVSDLPVILGGNTKYSDDPVERALGALFSVTSLFGKGSPHSNYSCVSCPPEALSSTDAQIRKIVITPTLIDEHGNTKRLQ